MSLNTEPLISGFSCAVVVCGFCKVNLGFGCDQQTSSKCC